MLVELSVMEQRYQAVMEVLGAHVPVTEVAERYGVSRQAVHRWIRHYRSGGIGALIDQPKTPRGSPLRLDPAVEAAICEMRRNHRRWGPRTLAYWLGQDGIDPVPARSTIYRVLVRNNLIVPVPRKRKRESYVRWERDEPMELWQHDFISGVFLKSGRELKVVTGIDDHSRYCVLAKVVTRASGRQVSLAFAQALSAYGIPDEVLSDNGVQFTNRLIKRKTMGESLFERICRDNNIVQRFTKVASPTTTGKIERLHLTMREMLDEHGPFTDVEEAQAVFDTWRAEYNEIRPHQSLDMATPASRFVPRPETVADLVLPAELRIVDGHRVITVAEEPEHFVPEPNGAEVDLEAVEFTRVVPACGNLSIGEQQIWIGPKSAGRDGAVLGRHGLGARVLGRRASQDRALEAEHQLAAPPARRGGRGGRPSAPLAGGHRAACRRCHLGARAHRQRGRTGVPRRRPVPCRLQLRRRTGAHRLGRATWPTSSATGSWRAPSPAPCHPRSASGSRAPGWPRRSTCAPSPWSWPAGSRPAASSGSADSGWSSAHRIGARSSKSSSSIAICASWRTGPHSKPWPATPPKEVNRFKASGKAANFS